MSSTIYYIDVRVISRFEYFYQTVRRENSVSFVKSKVASIIENQKTKDVIPKGVGTEGYHCYENRLDLAVLAIGMEPSVDASNLVNSVVWTEADSF